MSKQHKIWMTIGACLSLTIVTAITTRILMSQEHATTTIETAASQPATGHKFQDVFGEPFAVVDQDGKTILTSRAAGHAVVCDWNGDGKNDLILGCHVGMDTMSSEILLIENIATAAEPKFQWPATQKVLLGNSDGATCSAPSSAATSQAGGEQFTGSCGCKMAGTYVVMPTDWNGDGLFDLIVNTHWSDGVQLLINTGKKDQPVFRKEKKLFEISTHGKDAGAGDWNSDGLTDFVFPASEYGWSVYYGKKNGNGVVIDETKGLSSDQFKIIGHDDYPKIDGKNIPWFRHTPYAWNFSGKQSPDKLEVVACMRAGDKKWHINYYIVDTKEKTCTLQGTLATTDAGETRLSIGDINGDGAMDIIYTGGVFTKGQDTQIWVIPGKVKNIPLVKN